MRSPYLVGLLFGLQLALFMAAKLPLALFGRVLRRPSVFVLVICVSIVLFPERCRGELARVSVAGWTLQLCSDALGHALLMAVRLYTVILASTLVRARDTAGTFVAALSGMGLPVVVALPLDAALGYLAPASLETRPGRHRRKGGADEPATRQPRKLGLRDLVRGGGMGAMRDSLFEYLDWSEKTLEARRGSVPREALVDAAILAALTILAMLVRYIQVLPNLPFAPGYKGIVHIPLFIIAAQTVAGGFGGTKLGAVTGIIGFMTGQGGYGIFEVAKQVSPGLLADLLVLLFGGRRRSLHVAAYVVMGALVGAGRFATMVLITVLMDAPKALYALLGPVLLSQCLFGAASGAVSKFLVGAVLTWRAQRHIPTPEGASTDMPRPNQPERRSSHE
ncbi:MAG TPA: hypothetical protein VF400_09240 [Anaeromyxobacteraceae bacterium]